MRKFYDLDYGGSGRKRLIDDFNRREFERKQKNVKFYTKYGILLILIITAIILFNI